MSGDRVDVCGVAASVVVSALALARHDDLMSVASIVIVFLMGAIPVALPAVMTIVQAVGATGLSKRGVLVTRLDSVEDASSIDMFCFDKTGTITQNRLSVTGCVPCGPYSEADVARMAALASRREENDAIDEAIIEYADKGAVSLQGYEQLSYLPFDPANKRTEAVAKHAGACWRIAKGSPKPSSPCALGQLGASTSFLLLLALIL
jgi:H+-transporting ATPase